ncbi:MAG: alpha/beta hydrolase [Gemmatimonadetes bacterium]|nr:alpha/beta hydrolase [Gemmatimonadota bacterium]
MHPALRRGGMYVGASAVLLYIGAMGYLKVNETDFVYHPSIEQYENGRINPPADTLQARPVTFSSTDGAKLAAWVMPPMQNDSTALWVLISHGNAGNITLTKRQDFYTRLRALGVGLFAYEYRGFGASEKRPITEAGLYNDAQGAYDYLRKTLGVPSNRIIIFGHSLGSGVAIELATHAEAAGLIVEGAYTGVDRVAAERYPIFPIRALMANHFPSLERIDRVSMPKLFLHANNDAVIPFAHGRALYNRAREPREFVETGGGHEDAYRLDPRYLESFGAFVRRVAPSQGPQGESPLRPR